MKIFHSKIISKKSFSAYNISAERFLPRRDYNEQAYYLKRIFVTIKLFFYSGMITSYRTTCNKALFTQFFPMVLQLTPIQLTATLTNSHKIYRGTIAYEPKLFKNAF